MRHSGADVGTLSRNSGFGNRILGAPTRGRLLREGLRRAPCSLLEILGGFTPLEFLSALDEATGTSFFFSTAEFIDLVVEPLTLSGVRTRSDLRTLADWRKAAAVSLADVAVVS